MVVSTSSEEDADQEVDHHTPRGFFADQFEVCRLAVYTTACELITSGFEESKQS